MNGNRPPETSQEPITPASMHGPGAKRGPQVWIYVAFGLVILLLLKPWVDSSEPEVSWTQIGQTIQEEWQAGDGIYFYPPFAPAHGEPLQILLDSMGVNQTTHLLRTSPTTVADRARFSRLWIITPSDDHPDEVIAAAGDIQDYSPLHLIRADLGTAPIKTDFVAQLAHAKVARIFPGNKTRECPWNGEIHQCDKRFWTAVKSRIAEVGNTRRHIIFGHAYPNRGELQITYPQIQLGHTLSGGVGLTLRAVRKERGGDSWFRIRINGTQVYEATLPRGDFGWHEFQIDTGAQVGTPSDVRFEIGAVDTGHRQLAFDAVSF